MKPALTKEEWRKYAPWILTASASDRDLNIEACLHSFGQHGAAAIALYGQSFGFTREDVEVLRTLDAHSDVYDERVYGVIQRIEALLPPEDAGNQ